MKRVYQVSYTSVITFEDDDIPIKYRTKEGGETLAEAAFFANQIGEYKLKEITVRHPNSGVEEDVELEMAIPFDTVDDLGVLFVHYLDDEGHILVRTP